MLRNVVIFLGLFQAITAYAQQNFDTVYFDQRNIPAKITDTRSVVMIDTQMGDKTIAQYIDGKIHGEWIRYRSNGELFKIEHFVMGKKNGCSTIYGVNGPTIVANTQYLDGEEDGTQHFYDVNEKLTEEILWDSGKIIGRSTFYPNGQIKNEQRYWMTDSSDFNAIYFPYFDLPHNAKINDSTNALGDQWYENGQPKVKCLIEYDTLSLLLHFKYYSVKGDLLTQGAFLLRCNDIGLCLFEPTGEWWRRE